MSDWADEVELDAGALPEPTETIKDGKKTITEYRINKDDKKEKIVRTYEKIRYAFSRSVARRKKWHKFGESQNDPPGPNPHTTFVSDDVKMEICREKKKEETEVEPKKGK